ncbi:MAG: sugar phosphate isomerase/epimerase [Phycisphaeraceae bacterium]|nr:sugar phosphate isomerase/epimerase [Phycisphaeraceae bacterium]
MNDPSSSTFSPLPRLDGPRTYRLGVSSYVYPADLMINLRNVAGCADDVELVLFETPEASNIPTPADIGEMLRIARESRMTYTVHFPIEFQIGAADPTSRRLFLDQARRLIDLTRPLPVWAYILHLEGIADNADAGEIRRWQADCAAGVEQLLATGVAPRMFVVENLSYPFDWCLPVIERFNLAVCIDIGHLWIGGYDVKAHLDRHLPRTRLFHLHGEKEGKDHISLVHVDPMRLPPVFDALRSFTGVVTLELFDYEETAGSIGVLSRGQR